MKPHPRIRKTVKWVGAVVAVLLWLIWPLSVWRRVGVEALVTGYVFIHAGQFRIGWFEPWKLRSRHITATSDTWPGTRMRWWFELDHIKYMQQNVQRFTIVEIAVPIWALAVPVSLIAAYPFVRRRRINRAGKCAKCNYDRSGLALGAVCPECGATPTGAS